MSYADVPGMSYMALYIVSLHIIRSNSRTSTHWELNSETGKVQETRNQSQDEQKSSNSTRQDDRIMNILTNMVNNNGKWTLDGKYPGKRHCKACQERHIDRSGVLPIRPKHVDCGEPVNTTLVDHLRGILRRKDHPSAPEPEVAMMFKGQTTHNGYNEELDMAELEKKLQRLRKQRPRSVQVLTQIGNFWRIKGNTSISIECFRKALSYSPSNPEVFLNLARVLFNLQYLDDAIYLTKKSLELQKPEQNSWLQHFTLGEILKAYGLYHDATIRFRHTLELKPGFQPAQAHLREMEVNPEGSMTYYTLVIILLLVMGVLFGVLTTVDLRFEDNVEFGKAQRHFNRAMAMRSIKLGMSPRLRVKKGGL